MTRAAPEPLYERLAYEAAQRALDKQERLIDELRSRTGLLSAAASLAASFLGNEAFARDPSDKLVAAALLSFLVATAASSYVLLPTNEFVFALAGSRLYEGLFEFKDDLAEVYRRLAYDLVRCWDHNDIELQKLIPAFRLATVALAVEIVVLVTMVSDTLL